MIKITTKTIRVMAPNEATDSENEDVVEAMNWSHIEDSINDQLPDGYYCKLED